MQARLAVPLVVLLAGAAPASAQYATEETLPPARESAPGVAPTAPAPAAPATRDPDIGATPPVAAPGAPSAPARAPQASAGSPDADDTSRNVQDRTGETVTPIDQGNDEADLRITQSIRQAIMDEDDLSMNAKNVKVITMAGVVTLRGPVESPQERERIEGFARQAPGVSRVDNQLEVDAD